MSQLDKMRTQLQEHVPEPLAGLLFLTKPGAYSAAIAGVSAGRNPNVVVAITATRVYLFNYKIRAWFRGIKIKDKKGPVAVWDRSTLRVSVEPARTHATVTFWAPDGVGHTFTAVTIGKKNRESQEHGLAVLTGPVPAPRM